MSKFKPGRSSTITRPRPRFLTSTPSRIGPPRTQYLDPVPPEEARHDLSGEQLPANALQNLGFITTLLFVFVRFSFIHEFISSRLGISTHLIIILGGISYLCCLLSGQAFRAFQDKSTLTWCCFLGCFCLATATSFWRGGSLRLLLNYVETIFPVIVLIPAVTVTRSQLVKMLCTIGLACVLTLILGAISEDYRMGRMGADAAGSDIQDPNEYAAHILMMLPALGFLALRPGRKLVTRLAGIVMIGLGLVEILRTGSRGGLVSLAAMAVYTALVSPAKIRIGILVAVPMFAAIAAPFIPAEASARLKTLVSSSVSDPVSAEAAESKEARKMLLEESWKATLHHPLTGVGPGIFMDYQADRAKENGQRGMWHVSHNAYTQVSSECGIPALIFFLAGIGQTFFTLRKCSKTRDPELRTVALFMTAMVVGYSVSLLFLSLAYNIHLLVISATAVALKLRLQADGNLPEERHATAVIAREPVLA